MFEVIRAFQDKDGHLYIKGDVYPRKGTKKPPSARIKQLTTTSNKYGRIYIKPSTIEVEGE